MIINSSYIILCKICILAETSSEENEKPTLLHTETIVNDKRRYFLDLRENNRGRFLRITQSCVYSGTRFSIALPSQGITQLRDTLAELLDEYGEGYLNGKF